MHRFSKACSFIAAIWFFASYNYWNITVKIYFFFLKNQNSFPASSRVGLSRLHNYALHFLLQKCSDLILRQFIIKEKKINPWLRISSKTKSVRLLMEFYILGDS